MRMENNVRLKNAESSMALVLSLALRKRGSERWS